ncbi:hypothetical protein I3W98_39480, partial [Streptomyces cavourensis]|nr:hypothetical protein [Streptomyces cavourensis]
ARGRPWPRPRSPWLHEIAPLLSAPVQPPPAVQTPYPQSSAAAVPRHPAPSAERAGAGAVRPSLLAGEELDAPDPHIFRGTD